MKNGRGMTDLRRYLGAVFGLQADRKQGYAFLHYIVFNDIAAVYGYKQQIFLIGGITWQAGRCSVCRVFVQKKRWKNDKNVID